MQIQPIVNCSKTTDYGHKNPQVKQEIITCAAIKLDGKTYVVPRPKRHHHIISNLVKSGVKPTIKGVQGFVTNLGRFVTRSEGRKIATESGQIIKTISRELTSEDLW